MADKLLVVRAEEYLEQVGERAFIGLPREEIERLHGSLELIALERAEAAAASGLLPLSTFSVIHYNYSWLTFDGAPRSLGIRAPLGWEAAPPAFLDGALQASAQRALESALALDVPCQWRLAGLIRQDEVGLVYLARLPRRVEAGRRACGNGELRMQRAQFEPWSQLVIDNLDAM